MKRKTVPIVAGAKKILGMSIAEWNINLFLSSFYLVWMPGWKAKAVFFLVQLVLITIYGQIKKRFEEDFISIAIRNQKIPTIVYGIYSNPLPLKNMVTKLRILDADS